jgi:hypothetical protein
LPAESIRDNALSISGLLRVDIGGPSSKPYQPAGFYRHLNFPKREYATDANSNQWRRGVYVHWQRQYLHPMLRAFDASTREECAAQRARSSTPLAALVLLNDPTFIEAARVRNRAHYKADRIGARGLVTTGIAPVPKDADYLELAAWTGLCRALLNLSETITRE